METKRLSTNTCSDYSDDEISFGARSRNATPSLSQPATPLRPLYEEEHVDVHSPKATPNTGMLLDIKKLNLTPKSEIRRSLENPCEKSPSCQRMVGYEEVGESTEKELLAHKIENFAEDFDQMFNQEVEVVKTSHNISITDLCDSITKLDLDCSLEKRNSLSKNTSPYVPGEVRTEIHNLGNLLMAEANKNSSTVFISQEEEEELLGGAFDGEEEEELLGGAFDGEEEEELLGGAFDGEEEEEELLGGAFDGEEEEEDLLGGAIDGEEEAGLLSGGPDGEVEKKFLERGLGVEEEDQFDGNISQFDELLDQDLEVLRGKSPKPVPKDIDMSEIAKYFEDKYNYSFDQATEDPLVKQPAPSEELHDLEDIHLDRFVPVAAVTPTLDSVETGLYEGVGESSFLYKSLDIPQNEESFVVLPESGEERLSGNYFQRMASDKELYQESVHTMFSEQLQGYTPSSDDSVIVIPEPTVKPQIYEEVSDTDLSAYLAENRSNEEEKIITAPDYEDVSETDLSEYLSQDENSDMSPNTKPETGPELYKPTTETHSPIEISDFNSEKKQEEDQNLFKKEISPNTGSVLTFDQSPTPHDKITDGAAAPSEQYISLHEEPNHIDEVSEVASPEQDDCEMIVEEPIARDAKPLSNSINTNTLSGHLAYSPEESTTEYCTEILASEEQEHLDNKEVEDKTATVPVAIEEEVSSGAGDLEEKKKNCAYIEKQPYTTIEESSGIIKSSNAVEEDCYFSILEEPVTLNNQSILNQEEYVKSIDEIDPINFTVDPFITNVDPVSIEDDPVSVEVDPVITDVDLVSVEDDPVSDEVDPVITDVDPVSVEDDPINFEVDPVITDADPVSAEDDPINFEVDPFITDVDPVSIEDDPVSVEVDPVITDVDLVSVEDDPVSVEVDPVITDVDLVSVEDDPVSVEVDPINFEVDPVITDVDLVSVEDDPVSVEVDPVITNVDLVSVEDDPVSVEVDPVSVEVDPVITNVDLVSVEDDPVSVEVDSVITDIDLVSVEDDPVSVEVDPVITDVDLVSVEDDPVSVEVDPVITNVDPVSVEDDPVSVEVDPVSVEVDPVITNVDLVSVEDDPVSVEVDSVITDIDLVSVEESPVSVEVDPVSVEVDPVITNVDLVSVEDDPVSVEVDSVITDIDLVSVEDGPVSVEDDPVSVEVDPVITDVDLVSVEDDPVSVEVDSIITDVDLVSVEDGPVSVEESPVSVEDDLGDCTTKEDVTQEDLVSANNVLDQFDRGSQSLSEDIMIPNHNEPGEMSDQIASTELEIVTNLSRTEEQDKITAESDVSFSQNVGEISGTSVATYPTEENELFIARPDFLEEEDYDSIAPLCSRDSMSSVKSRESLGLLPPSYLANIDNDDLFISQVNSPSVLFGDKEKSYLRQVLKPPSPMYQGQQIVMEPSKRVRDPATTPVSYKPKLLRADKKNTPVKAVHSTTPKRGAARPPTPTRGAARPPTPTRDAARPPTPTRDAARPPTPTRGASKPPRPSTLPCMAPQKEDIGEERSTFAAFRAKLGSPVSKTPSFSPVSKSASAGDMKQPWMPPSPRPHMQAPVSPRSRPMSPCGTPKKSQSYEGSGCMTPQRNLPLTPTRPSALQARSNYKPTPVISTPPRIRQKKICSTPPRGKGDYASSKSASAGTLLIENNENAAPKKPPTPRVRTGAVATPRIKAGAVATATPRDESAITKPATPKIKLAARSNTLNRPLAKPKPSSDLSESAKKKPTIKAKIGVPPKLAGISKINTGLAGRADLKKVADKSKLVGGRAVTMATPGARRPVLGSLENKAAKQDDTANSSKSSRVSNVNKPADKVSAAKTGGAVKSGVAMVTAVKSGVASRSRIPAPRSRLPSKLPTRSNK
ncbi:uncharacterized protein LOC134826492 [Bolinopsis microptera]|uniref:uncharacterized protein LOC134826492 n=1 Tax=Bolinopsis microptera TaxID=2820187 RepID=UPI0030793CFB